MPLRPCSHPACPALVKKGRCPKHEALFQLARQELRESQPGREMYFTQRWKERRAQQLAAYPYCAKCGERATVADHVVPHRGDEGVFWSGPLQSLCSSCHGRKTAGETWHQHRGQGQEPT